MKRLDAVAFVSAILAVVLGGYAILQLRAVPKRAMGTVTIFVVLEQRGDQCVVSSKTESVYAARGQVVAWQVENNCQSEQEFSLVDFTMTVPPRGPRDPFGNPPHTRRVPPNAVRHLPRMVSLAAELGTYTYAIALNGVKQSDPEIIIEY